MLSFNIFRYRLAPKYTFPAQFHDCYAVVKTLLATGDKYGIDTSRLVVSGDSAGGNLAAAVALKLRDEGKQQLAAQVRTPQTSSSEAAGQVGGGGGGVLNQVVRV